MNKNTRFQRKYVSNDRVKIGNDNKVWVVCKTAIKDDNKHLYYKVSRGSWKKYVRSDELKSA